MWTKKSRLPWLEILAFGLLPSPLKRLAYRLRGFQVGKGVSFGFGSVVTGRSVRIGDYTRIGFLTIIRGNVVRLGNRVHFGALTYFDTPVIDIGDGTRVNELVFVGGLQSPRAEFIVGRNCQIMQLSFINPAQSIRIGDGTGIGGHTLIFGHSSWQNIFDGYPVQFEPIRIGSNVSLAWRTFILPGTMIGDGATVAANSVVRGSIPGKSMAAGFPARIVAGPPDYPRLMSEADREILLTRILGEFTVILREAGCTVEGSDTLTRVTGSRSRWQWRKPRTWTLFVFDESRDSSVEKMLHMSSSIDVVLSLKRLPLETRRMFESHGVLWVDLEKKQCGSRQNRLGKEVLSFLRRYGARFDVIEDDNADTSAGRSQH